MRAALVVAATLIAGVAHSGDTMAQHAKGTFTVDIKPLESSPAEGLGRMSIYKKISGDFSGTAKGEMLTGGDPKQGVAGYVAMEVFTGTLAGRHGSFALQHSATMTAEAREMTIIVVPGSGSGELKGIRGSFNIDIRGGQHFYDFTYTLPE